jgi:hypothetical protein
VDPDERVYLLQRIQDAERGRRRWKIAALFFMVAVGVLMLMTGGLGLFQARTLFFEARLERERALDAEMRARALAEEAAQQAQAAARTNQELKQALEKAQSKSPGSK